MKEKTNWIQIVFIIGVIGIIAGALDPMEGSVVIAIGSILLAIASYLKNDRHKNYFILYAALILVGVFFLFFWTSLGGIGGTSAYSMWWGLTMITYPIGWIATIVLLIVRAVQNKKQVRIS